MRSAYTKVIVAMAMLFAGVAAAADWMDEVEDHFADSNGVKIHYVTAGEGPLVLLIHEFPDFWYSWQHQMRGLSSDYRVAAMDTRGYNKSDKPEGVEIYDMSLLVAADGYRSQRTLLANARTRPHSRSHQSIERDRKKGCEI